MKFSYTYWLLAAFLGGNILADSSVSCRQATLAEVYSVTALSQCGRELPNSFLRGMINRRRPCAEETLVARVYASRETCESCSSRSQVEQIRCDRGGCNVCEVRGYVSANVQDLASVSLRVRLAAARSLRLCGLSVTSRLACVEEKVPSYAIHQDYE